MYTPGSIESAIIAPFDHSQIIQLFLLPTAAMNLINQDHQDKLDEESLWMLLKTTARFVKIWHPVGYDDEQDDSALSSILQTVDALFQQATVSLCVKAPILSSFESCQDDSEVKLMPKVSKRQQKSEIKDDKNVSFPPYSLVD